MTELVTVVRFMGIFSVFVGFVLIALSGVLQDPIGMAFGWALLVGGALVVWKV